MKTNLQQKKIPQGWQKTRLSEIGIFSKGSGITKNQLTETGHNAIRYGELYKEFNFKIKKIYSHIPSRVASTATKIKYGDILFAGSGETNEEIGKSAAYLLNQECYAGGDLIIFTPKNANSLFLSYSLNIGEGRKKLTELGQGQSVVHIYKSEIEKLKLHLPPTSEQNCIVTVLENWDKSIEKITQKIEIKKRIKKGLMQDLLTGKKRLCGFCDKWEINKLKNVCNVKKGEQLNKEHMLKGGKYPALNGGIEASGFTDKYNTDDNVITISEGGNSCGYVNFSTEKFWCGGHCYTVFPNKNIDNFFLYQLLKFKQKEIMSLRVGSGLPNIQKKTLDNFRINIPKSKEEQKAISKILTIADKEITKLEQKSSIFKEQNKFLLNNLINGTIRTPENLLSKGKNK